MLNPMYGPRIQEYCLTEFHLDLEHNDCRTEFHLDLEHNDCLTELHLDLEHNNELETPV